MNRYAELHYNDVEMWIKSHMITILVKLGYAVETVAGTKPSAFTWLERCNNIAGIALSTETIDRKI